MRLRGNWILSLLAIVVVCVVGWTVYGQKQQSSARRTIWEYKISNSPSEEQISEIAGEGWELVAVSPSNSGSPQLYFKRAK